MKTFLRLSIFAAIVLPYRLGIAHPLEFGLLELRESADKKVQALFRYSGSEHAPVGGTAVLPRHCRTSGAQSEQITRSGNTLRWVAHCEHSLRGSRVGVAGLEGSDVQVLLRAFLADGGRFETLLDAAKTEATLPLAGEDSPVFFRYTSLGIEHILLGMDHLLFVLALLLLVRGGGRLVKTVTAFTIGHSVTLSLAALDLFALPPAPTEAVIALSVVFVCAELLSAEDPPNLARRRPEIASGGFGLFHGLGFAGALREVGLPQGEVPLALFSFNAGVEIGQLLFLAGALALSRAARRWTPEARAPYRPAGAYAMGALAAFWFWQRVVAALI